MAGIGGMLSPNYKYREFEDFSRVLKRWRAAETPMLGMAGVGEALTNYEFTWSVDKYDTPLGARGHVDGVAVATADLRDNSSSLRRMGNIGQAFRRAYGIGWIQEAVAKMPGDSNRLSKVAKDQLLVLKQEIEGAISSADQVATSDNGTNGSLMSGLGKLTDRTDTWTDTTAPTDSTGLTLGKCPLSFAPPAGQAITGRALEELSYQLINDVLLTLRQTTKQKGNYVYLCGLLLRQACTLNLVLPAAQVTSATAVANKIWAFSQQINDKELGASVTRISGDFGAVDIMDSDWIGNTTVDSTGAVTATRADRVVYPKTKYGYIFQRDNIELRYGVRPETGPYADNGAGEYEWVRAFAGLVVWNPQGVGRTFFE